MVVMVYSEKIEIEMFPASKRFGKLIEVFKVIQPAEADVENLILKVHGVEYLEKAKKHPFYSSAVENLRCIITGVEILDEHDVVVVPALTAGHLAERNRMRGSCLFNGLAVAVKLLSSKGKVAVIETDAHHGCAAVISGGEAKFFCIGEKGCEISDDLRCVLGRQLGKGYVDSIKKMVEKVASYNPDFLIWYLGMDLDSREYSEMDVGDWEELIKVMSEVIGGRKTLIMLSSGSREDVLREISLKLLHALSR